MKKMEFNIKKDGKWRPFTMDSFSGVPVASEVWESMEGKEIVAKFTVDESVCYIAGTPELIAHYLGRGLKAISFTTAVDQMRKKDSPFIDDTLITYAIAAMKEFPGTALTLILPEEGGKA